MLVLQLSKAYSGCLIETLYLLISSLPFFPSPQPLNLTISDTSYKGNHAVFVELAYSTLLKVLLVQP